MRFNYIYLVVFLALAACSHTSNRLTLGKTYAEKELNEALSNQTQHNVINNKQLILSDEKTAIKVVEPILFDIYGQKNIEKQRPYESYLIDNHWVIMGTLPKEYVGGTFLIILDARNCRILRITHGK